MHNFLVGSLCVLLYLVAGFALAWGVVHIKYKTQNINKCFKILTGRFPKSIPTIDMRIYSPPKLPSQEAYNMFFYRELMDVLGFLPAGDVQLCTHEKIVKAISKKSRKADCRFSISSIEEEKKRSTYLYEKTVAGHRLLGVLGRIACPFKQRHMFYTVKLAIRPI